MWEQKNKLLPWDWANDNAKFKPKYLYSNSNNINLLKLLNYLLKILIFYYNKKSSTTYIALGWMYCVI